MCHRLRVERQHEVPKEEGLWYRPAGDEYIYAASRRNVTYFPSRLPPVILSASEGSRYLPIVTQKLVNTSRREADSRKPPHSPTLPLSH